MKSKTPLHQLAKSEIRRIASDWEAAVRVMLEMQERIKVLEGEKERMKTALKLASEYDDYAGDEPRENGIRCCCRVEDYEPHAKDCEIMSVLASLTPTSSEESPRYLPTPSLHSNPVQVCDFSPSPSTPSV